MLGKKADQSDGPLVDLRMLGCNRFAKQKDSRILNFCTMFCAVCFWDV